MNSTILLGWLNFISLNISMLLFAYFSIASVMPVTRAEKRGDKAWKECYWFRIIMSVFVGIMIINMILWIWFPISELAWYVHPNPLIGIGIGAVIVIPCTIILVKALKDGGTEHMKPSKDTEMHKGIYEHIRHPGVWGEMPWYIAIGLFINSLFLALWMTLFVILYTPVYIYFEEKDLVKRFGDSYREYQQQTGALIPRFWQKKGKLT
ncbi:MAG: methyltransferase family protein [Candidatus Hodarchaeota archaeon]